jgi:hypothetical protein
MPVSEDASWTRAVAYVDKIEPAVSGSGGHTKTFTTACKIVRLVAGDAAKAWLLLLRYNERREPPWSEQELRHKLTEAIRLAR